MNQRNNQNKDQDLFHLFIQYTDRLPHESQIFPYFQYMDQSIRKNFNQLKKHYKKSKQISSFDSFWNDLNIQQKVKLYCNWVMQLRKALQMQNNKQLILQPESSIIQGQIYIRKTNLFNSWQKKIVKVTPTHLQITGRKNRDYQLKFYQIRKSKAKDSYGWVLKSIFNDRKSLHCQVGSLSIFQQWYQILTVNINNQRVQYFLQMIRKQRANPGSIIKDIKQKTEQIKKNINQNQKTLTQKMIDNLMTIVNQNQTNVDQIGQQQQDQFQSLEDKLQQKQSELVQNFAKNTIIKKSNPNIFKKIDPQYKGLQNFKQIHQNSVIIQSDSGYKIYQLPIKDGDHIVIKMSIILPFKKQLVFQSIIQQSKKWNQDIDIISIKTKISSQNSALIYQKNKSQGILYRQRDFLFLRHCFSIKGIKQNNTFIIDKSIDSIHHPPFMSVVRAQKKILWGLFQKQDSKQTLLVVQGWISGGGYMNTLQNKQMTIKHFKKITNLKYYIKKIQFEQKIDKNVIFDQNWIIDLNQKQKKQKNQNKQQQLKLSKQPEMQKKKSQKQLNQQLELAQFMKRTSQQENNNSMQKSQNQIVRIDDQSGRQLFKPPNFYQNKFVIIPNNYLKIKHIIQPKQKQKKPLLSPCIRGHHMWKGQWQVNQNVGGLYYIDQQKMNQQKKVLTYIIKRIGKNIFSGKGVLNISLPVDIFCVQSNIQRLAMSFGYFPLYIQKAVAVDNQLQKLKYILGAGISSSLIYLTMQKPFNPILGQTYQSWVDNCPIYFQQISHHPPIAAFMMYGRGYRVTGTVQAKMDLSINSGTGNNQGIFCIQFDNGSKFYYTTPAGMLQGLTYGQRKLNMVGKSYYWSQSGLFLQLTYNPSAKSKGFFSSPKIQGQQKFVDYLQGQIRRYTPQIIKQNFTKISQNKILPIIPKGLPNSQPLQILTKVTGRWNKYIKFGQQQIFNVNQDHYYSTFDQKNPLPSHCNYRQDLVYRRLKDFVISQQFKQILQQKQRNDRKLRAKYAKILH